MGELKCESVRSLWQSVFIRGSFMTHKAETAVGEMSNRWFVRGYFFIWFSGFLVGKRLMCDGPGVADNRWIRGVFLLLHQHFNYCRFTRDQETGQREFNSTTFNDSHPTARWATRVLPYVQAIAEVQARSPKQKFLYSASILISRESDMKYSLYGLWDAIRAIYKCKASKN